MTFIRLGILMVLTLNLYPVVVRSISPGDLLSNGDLQENINTNDEDLDDYKRKVVDPQGSWLTFVRHSKTTNTNKKQPRRNRRKNKKQRTLVGPEGPRGPPGPPGPPGTFVSKEELLEEFAALIKETSERRAKEIVSSMWPSCADALTFNTSSSVPDVIGSVVTLPRLAAGFNMRLDGNIHVTKRIFMELNNFKQPFQAGAFQRGDVFNAKEGRFLAPKDGIYYFSANLHIRVKFRRKEKKNMRGNDHLKIILCIDSLCQKYAFAVESETKDKLRSVMQQSGPLKAVGISKRITSLKAKRNAALPHYSRFLGDPVLNVFLLIERNKVMLHW